MRRRKISTLNILALLAILLVASAFIPSLFRTRASSRINRCESNLKNIGTSFEMYAQDHHGKYPDSLDEIIPKYLQHPQVCPIAKRETYRFYTGLSAPGNTEMWKDYYYIECYGENHHIQGVEGNYPAYNGVVGLIQRRPYEEYELSRPTSR